MKRQHMGEPEQAFPVEKYDQIWPGRWHDGQVLVLLLLLALGIRGWAIWQTEVPARDSIGFIRQALEFETKSWTQVLRDNHQHPGYPLTVLLVSGPIRWLAGGLTPDSMQLSAQVASSLPGWLLVLPMFWLGKHLFGRSVGFWAALVFQCLPGSGPVLSDGLSDPLFLCLAATALLFGVKAVQGKSLWPFAWCGLFSGLTYLVRPEGVLIAAATTLTIFGLQVFPRWRRQWSQTVACAAALLTAALLAGSPYYLAVGSFTNKPTGQMLTGLAQAPADSIPPALAGRGPLFAANIDSGAAINKRMYQGMIALCGEFSHAYLYVGWMPALLGLWWCRERARVIPGAWVMLTVFLLHTLLVWWLAVRAGYVSDRHILLLVLCTVYLAVAVLMQLPFRLTDWLQARTEKTRDNKKELLPLETGKVSSDPDQSVPLPSRRSLGIAAATWAMLLLLLLTGAGLSRTLRPIHGNRAGHHHAGIWLASHSQVTDRIADDHYWAHYYAGRVFLEGTKLVSPPGYRPVTYVVISRANEKRGPVTPRTWHEADVQAKGGTVVFQWPEGVVTEKAQVVIYQLSKL